MKEKSNQTEAEMLENVVRENQAMKRLLKKQELLAKGLLFRWLTEDTHRKVNQYIKYYRPEQRMEMINAMQTYVLTGKRTRFRRAVQNWHFRLFCELIDDDRYSVPAHALLKRLWEKIGLLKSITSNN